MSSGALYRKYRPKNFDDVIDQQHITTTLRNSIKNKTFAHAYLLTGPRGVGKTTVARLFAYAVNDVSYNEEQNYSDIIEIDAASNRRIDEIRELREKINIAPSILKYKVYIIDEVHMLTREAFNALLKTLEEPPAHALFILATTDFHKVPDTIVSRCVRFSFSSISMESTQKHLSYIAKQEKINIEDEAISIIASSAEGSFRDAISFLEQFRNSGKSIEASYVAQALGQSSTRSLEKLLEAVNNSQPKAVLEQLASIRESGSNDSILIKQLSAYLRDCLLDKHDIGLSEKQIVDLSSNLLKVHDYADTSLALEIVLIEASIKNKETGSIISTPDKVKKKEKITPLNDEKEIILKSDSDAGEDLWQSILSQLKSTNTTLYSIARMAKINYAGSVLELNFKFPFHYKQMNLEKNRSNIQQLAQSIDGRINKVEIKMLKSSGITDSDDDVSLKDISNIFGSAEVIES